MGSQHRWPCWLFWQPVISILLVVIKFCSVLFVVQKRDFETDHVHHGGGIWAMLNCTYGGFCGLCGGLRSPNASILFVGLSDV